MAGTAGVQGRCDWGEKVGGKVRNVPLALVSIKQVGGNQSPGVGTGPLSLASPSVNLGCGPTQGPESLEADGLSAGSCSP